MNDNRPNETILIVEPEVLARAALSEYLRHCGYIVVEAASNKEAIKVLTEENIPVNIVFTVLEIEDSSEGFGLVKWVRQNRPGIHVILASDIVKAAHMAGDLCEAGPHLEKPYQPQQVIEWIKKLRNVQLQT